MNQLDMAIQALRDMAHPIEAMRQAVPEGYEFNPHEAMRQAESAQWYKRHAQDALNAIMESFAITTETQEHSHAFYIAVGALCTALGREWTAEMDVVQLTEEFKAKWADATGTTKDEKSPTKVDLGLLSDQLDLPDLSGNVHARIEQLISKVSSVKGKVISDDYSAKEFMESCLQDFYNMAAAWPDVRVDPDIWPSVRVYMPIRSAIQDDVVEQAYWNFDARQKGYGEFKGQPQTSERDAYKTEMRNVLHQQRVQSDNYLIHELRTLLHLSDDGKLDRSVIKAMIAAHGGE